MAGFTLERFFYRLELQMLHLVLGVPVICFLAFCQIEKKTNAPYLWCLPVYVIAMGMIQPYFGYTITAMVLLGALAALVNVPGRWTKAMAMLLAVNAGLSVAVAKNFPLLLHVGDFVAPKPVTYTQTAKLQQFNWVKATRAVGLPSTRIWPTISHCRR